MKNLAKKTTLSVATLSMVLSNMPAVNAEVVEADLQDLEASIEEMKDAAGEIFENVNADTIKDLVNEIKDAANNYVGEDFNEENIKETVDSVVGELENVKTELENVGVNTENADVEDIVNGIVGGLGNIDEEQASEVANKVLENLIPSVSDKTVEEDKNVLEQIEDILDTVGKVSDTINGVSGDITDAKHELEGKIEDLSNTTDKVIADVNTTIKDHYDEITNEIDKIIAGTDSTVDTTIENLDTALDAFNKELNEKVEEAEKEATEATEEIEGALEGIENVGDELTEELESITGEIEENQTNINEMIDETLANIEANINKMESIESSVNYVTDEEGNVYTEAEWALKQAQNEENAVKAEIENVTSQITNSLTYNQELVNQLTELQARAEEASANAKKAQELAEKEANAAKENVENLETIIGSTQDMLTDLQVAIEEAKAIDGDLDELMSKYAEAVSQLDFYQTQLTNASIKLEAAKVAIGVANEAANAADKVLDATQGKMDAANETISSIINAAVAKAEKEAESAEKNAEIAQAQAEAARLEAEAAYEAWKAAGDDVILQAEYLAKDAAYKLATDVALKAAEEAKAAQEAVVAAKKAEIENVVKETETVEKEVAELENQKVETESAKNDAEQALNNANATVDSLTGEIGTLTDEIAEKEESLTASQNGYETNKNEADGNKEFNETAAGKLSGVVEGLGSLVNGTEETDGLDMNKYSETITTTEDKTNTNNYSVTGATSALGDIVGTNKSNGKVELVMQKYELVKTAAKTETVNSGSIDAMKTDIQNYLNEGKSITVTYTYEVKTWLGDTKETKQYTISSELDYLYWKKCLADFSESSFGNSATTTSSTEYTVTTPAYSYQLVEGAEVDNVVVDSLDDCYYSDPSKIHENKGEYVYYPSQIITSWTETTTNTVVHTDKAQADFEKFNTTVSYVDKDGVSKDVTVSIDPCTYDEHGNVTGLKTTEQIKAEYETIVSQYGENNVITDAEDYWGNFESRYEDYNNKLQAEIDSKKADKVAKEAELEDAKNTQTNAEVTYNELLNTYNEILESLTAKNEQLGSLKDQYDTNSILGFEYATGALAQEILAQEAILAGLKATQLGAEEANKAATAELEKQLDIAKQAVETLLNGTEELGKEAAMAAYLEAMAALEAAKKLVGNDVVGALEKVQANYQEQADSLNTTLNDAQSNAQNVVTKTEEILADLEKTEVSYEEKAEKIEEANAKLEQINKDYEAAVEAYNNLQNTAIVAPSLENQKAKLEDLKATLEAAEQTKNDAALVGTDTNATTIKNLLCNDGTGLACKLNVTLNGKEVGSVLVNTSSVKDGTISDADVKTLVSHVADEFDTEEARKDLGSLPAGFVWQIKWNVAQKSENGDWTVSYSFEAVADKDYDFSQEDDMFPTPEVDYEGTEPETPVVPEEPETPVNPEEPTTPENPEDGDDSTEDDNQGSGNGSGSQGGSGSGSTNRPSYSGGGSGSGSGSSSGSSSSSQESEDEEEILDIEEEETAQGTAITNPIIAAVADQPLRTFLSTLAAKEEIKPYSNFGLKIFDNSRVTSIKATSTGFTINGYMWIDNVKPGANTWREIVLVNTEDMSMENAYRKQATATKTEWLNKNMTATQNGKLDLSEAGYTIDINYNDLNSYVGNKSGATIKAGTYQLFIRISDGKDSFLFPLVDKVLSDGSTMESTGTLPEGFDVMDNEVRSLTVTIK